MRVLGLALALLLVGAAPAEVPIGHFQTWFADKKMPLTFISDGVSGHVEILPCPTEDSACRTDGYNPQAAVTVSAPGVMPLTVMTDLTSGYNRIAVVRFDRRDARSGLIVESQYGGSSGALTVQLLIPNRNGYKALALGRHDLPYLEGELPDGPKDLSGDGRIELKFGDSAFDSTFGCNACTPRPPRVFAVKDGRIIEESRDPALRALYEVDMSQLAAICLSKARYRNGACAAYVADAARAGRFNAAWTAMLKHYEHDGDLWNSCSLPESAWENNGTKQRAECYHDFPSSLRAFLARTGYLPG